MAEGNFAAGRQVPAEVRPLPPTEAGRWGHCLPWIFTFQRDHAWVLEKDSRVIKLTNG